MKKIITISRQYGSGGRSVGRKVAAQLGFELYDKEVLEQVAEQTGLHKDFIKQKGEYANATSKLAYAFSSLGAQNVIHGMSMEDYIWSVQRRVILELAEKGNCVFIGRCADFILKDRDDVLNVYLSADKEARARRIVELYGETDVAPEKRLKDTDTKRALYYNHYTDQEWGKAEYYDIMLNTTTIGVDRCANFIIDVAKYC